MGEHVGSPVSGPTVRPRRVPIWWWFAAVLALAIAAYSLRYVFIGEPAYVPELAASFRERGLTVTVHTLFGPVALVLGLAISSPPCDSGRNGRSTNG